jgi:hypothetical protein
MLPAVTPRTLRTLTALSLAAWTWSSGACVSTSVQVRSRYPGPEPELERPAASEPMLVSAQMSSFGIERAPLHEVSEPRPVERSEAELDRLLLVFAEQVDPLNLDPRAFAILRADGRRVRPTRAMFSPADEGDENRSVTLLGEFGTEQAPPVAVHVIGQLYTESGLSLHGLDAEIMPASVPDRPVVIERLAADERRCPGAAQVIRSTWTDVLREVGEADLAGIELGLADGRTVHPIDFDDQAVREGDEPCPASFASSICAPLDDNVLDLCLDTEVTVVHLRFAAGLFRDANGLPSAAAEIELPPTSPTTAAPR